MKKNYKLIFYITTFMFWSALYSHVSILSSYAEKLMATAQMIGLISGGYGFMQFLLRVPLGILSDRLQKRKIFITAAMVASFFGGIVMVLVPTPTGLLVGRILCGISACAYVQMTILYSSYYDDEHLPKAMGLMVALMNLAKMVSMLIGGITTDAFGVNSTFILTSVYALIGIIVSLFIYDKPIDKDPIKMRDLKPVVVNTTLLTAALLAIITQAISFGKSWTFVPLATARLGGSGMWQSVMTVSFTFMSMMAALYCGRITKRIGEKKVLAFGYLLSIISSIIIPLMTTIPVLLISQIISGIGDGLLFALLLSISVRTIEKHLRGSAMGIYQSLYGIGMFVGPWVFGTFADKYPLNYGFTATAVLSLVGLVLVFFVVKNDKKQVA